MDPFTAAVASGGASLIGTYMTNEANKDMSRENRASNIQEARESRKWQEKMSNSAYQRSMQDMKAAGLNPMLAYQQGGASTPSGATASSTAPIMENALGAGISTALETRRLKKELDATDSQTSLNNAISATQRAQTKLNETNAKVAERNVKALDAQLPAIKQRAKLDETRDRIDERMSTYDAIMKRTQQATGIVNDAASVIKPKINIGNPNRGTDRVIDSKTGEILMEHRR